MKKIGQEGANEGEIFGFISLLNNSISYPISSYNTFVDPGFAVNLGGNPGIQNAHLNHILNALILPFLRQIFAVYGR
jgi:hypothetical protein